MDYIKSIYKLDSKNKVRILTVSALNGELFQESGLLDGKLVLHTSVCTPKNIGKTNETTAKEQAILEAEALIVKKLKEGYSESIEQAKEDEVILPMLAKNYEDEKHKIDWNNCYIQPKLDGMRCLAFIDGKGGVKLMSRQGREITTTPHIIKDLSTITDVVILDGELYVHGGNFQENMRLIKKFRKGETDVKVKYHVYDLISKDPFWNRKVRKYIKGLFSCEEVSTYICNNEQTLRKWHSNNIEAGYEGSILRWGAEGYKINGRSSNLLKYKDFKDEACKVIDVLPSEKNPEQGVIHCVLKGKIFGCGMKFSHEERIEILKNKHKYIGQTAEVRFFEYSEDGIPRFPVVVGFKLD